MPQKKNTRRAGKKPRNANESAYTGIWITKTKPRLVYKVVPKAGCSSVGQVMNYIDTGSFFDANVHHVQSSILKWGNLAERKGMIQIIKKEAPFWFSVVRNPYSRVFSAFSDKIFGYQENGNRYSGGKIHKHLQKLGLKWGAGSNIIANFNIFLSFVETTVVQRKPMPTDPHWVPQYRLLKANAKLNPAFQFHHVGHIETFRSDIEAVIRGAGINHQKLPEDIPRENSTSIAKPSFHEFFGDEQIEIMRRVYAADFEYLGYSDHPSNLKPLGEIDLKRLNSSFRD